jgi:hypothetical protein
MHAQIFSGKKMCTQKEGEAKLFVFFFLFVFPIFLFLKHGISPPAAGLSRSNRD